MWRRLLAIVDTSLVRRLVVAQVVTALLLWLAAFAYLVHDTARYDELFEPRLMGRRADMILSVVDALAGQPEQLAQALVRIDDFQRHEHNEEDDPALRQTLNVWLGERLLYASPGEPGAVRTALTRQLERLQIGGKTWRTYTQHSETSDARVTFVRSGHTPDIIFALNGRGILILPLLISLPFLVIPAWLSVRVALRPWRRFSREIESRGPNDLAPLAFGSQFRELRPISQAVNNLLERVRSGLARERSFIADAAHELRTPLAAMRINVEALQTHRSDPRDQELLDGLVRSGERASRLVAQLLGLMRSDAQQPGFAMESLSLDALVQERLAHLSVLADARGVELELQSGAPITPIHGEREGLISLVDNLVENAIKYAPAGSMVTVTLAPEDDDLVLHVEDAGEGIPQALRERVFDRFYRAPDQAQPGSGLGLAIVKAVAQRHRASVQLSDRPNLPGLRVTVRFTPAAVPRH
jgi:two-component system sensor histidine kinase QseC